MVLEKKFLGYIVNCNPQTIMEYDKYYIEARQKYRICPKKSVLLKLYYKYYEPKENIINVLTKKLSKSSSGVIVITVLTSPFPKYMKDGKMIQQKFSCGENCAYCPKERGHNFNATIVDFKKNDTMNKLQLFLNTSYDINEVRVITNIIIDNITIPVYRYGEYKGNNFDIFINTKYLRYISIGKIIECIKVEQPRSYISTEPAVMRANRNLFDANKQFNDRANALKGCGHIIDKIELLVLGGTWSHYPREYQKEFIRDLYYSANVFYSNDRERLSLEDEIKINMNTKCRIIGLTLETRPDCINIKEIMRFRKYGCTRVQLGVQHIDDDILKTINRRCSTTTTIRAINMLKQNGYKVDIHLMPDLPGSNYSKDKKMFQKLLGLKKTLKYNNMIEYDLEYPELQADQWKIYPTEVTRWTKIFDMHKEGLYKPYSENINDITGNKYIEDLLLYVKRKVFPWIRLNRIIRDIPSHEIYGGNNNPSLRQLLQIKLKKQGYVCECIRCKEVKTRDIKDYKLFVRKYNGYKSDEYFISYESLDNKIIYGFIRLRLNHNNNMLCYDTLKNSALIRELHVYGKMVPHYMKNKNVQNIGFGRKLLMKAEEIARNNGYNKIAVISGIGVREYYNMNGYNLQDTYMVKNLEKKYNIFSLLILYFLLILFIDIIILF